MKARLFTLFAACCLLTASAFAENAADIRRRMEQRLPALDSQKAKETIGENNRGFVEVHGSGGAAASSLVADENRDRETVYAIIARETGATPDSVGKARAQKIAANSSPGVWVQDAAGQWHKK